jgi:hypothetical protein
LTTSRTGSRIAIARRTLLIMGNILSEHWQYATVVIKTEEGGVGTGVLVGTIDPVSFK